MVAPKADSGFRFITRSAAQTRVLDAALKLIGENNVGGTSLQMIADEIGVTKAAVYHQFKTKEEIVIALTERELGGLEEALEAAEAEQNQPRARELLLDGVIELAVKRRGVASTLQFDPVIVRLLAAHNPFQQFIQRLYGVLIGDAGDDARVSAAMLSGAIAVGVMHPLVSDIDDDTLRSQLLRITRRIIDVSDRSRNPKRAASARKSTVQRNARPKAIPADGR